MVLGPASYTVTTPNSVISARRHFVTHMPHPWGMSTRMPDSVAPLADPAVVFAGVSGKHYRAGSALARGRTSRLLSAHPVGDEQHEVVVKWSEPGVEQALPVEEARLLARLAQPTVPVLHDVGWAEGRFFSVIERVHGLDLATLVRVAERIGLPLGARVALELSAQLARAVHALHGARDALGQPLRIVHRHLWPEHAMVSWQGRVSLLGLSRADSSVRRAPVTSSAPPPPPGASSRPAPSSGRATLVPTHERAFTSPEHELGWQSDPADDVYALGCLLSYLACGRTPASGGLDAMLRQGEAQPVPGLSSDLQTIVGRACRGVRNRRGCTAIQLAVDCERAADDRMATEETAAVFLARLESAIWPVRPAIERMRNRPLPRLSHEELEYVVLGVQSLGT